MPYLGDYIGQLLAELAIARTQADLETVRLAELYASHPLLRTLPVPHVRLPEVDLDIPVLIKASEEAPAGTSARGGAKVADLRRKFDEVLDVHLSRAGVTLSDAERQQIRAALDERGARIGTPTEISVDVNRVADDLTSTAINAVEEMKRAADATEPAVSPEIAKELAEAARLEFLELRAPPPRLTVLVTSAQIRDAATTENLTRLRLKISEEGLEWSTIESEDGRRDRLVPE